MPDVEAAPADPEQTGEKGTARRSWSAAGWRMDQLGSRGLCDGSIAANADGGWVHNLGGDAFDRPACFEVYVAVEGGELGTIKNGVAKLRRHRLRRWERGVANTFRAEPRDGRKVTGMLFPGELIWDGDPPPLCGAQLC